MSVMMQTQNPEAHARMMNNAPLPEVGDMVKYHLRPGEMRAGYVVVPAMVMKVDAGNRLLTLLCIYDQNDQHLLPDVPERRGDDRGWEVRGGDMAGLRALVAAQGDRLERQAVLIQALGEAVDAFKGLAAPASAPAAAKGKAKAKRKG